MTTYAPALRFILRHQVQPWHPSSTLVHEAALAVGRLAPQGLLAFAVALMQRQTEYFDVAVVGETRNQTYGRLAKLAEDVAGVRADDILDLLRISDTPCEGYGALNVGNQVTDDLKIHIKAARLLGIHVSPTVVVDGIVENSISSGWTKEQWVEWLDKIVV